MTEQKISGYAAMAVGQPLEPYEYAPPALGENDVRVAVSHCGVCHTDIHAIQNYYKIVDFPFVPGHEIVGRISEAGAAVVNLAIGDRVGIGWQGRSCGGCEWCSKGEEHLCMDIVPSGTWVPYGGFSTSVVVDSGFAYPLPSALPSETAAVLMCAGVTVYSPLRTYGAEPRLRIGVVGVGGLGHLAIQFAHAMGAEVTAISSSAGKRAQSLAYGADRFVDVSDQAGLRHFGFYFDLLLCTASGGVRWEALLATLKKRGVLVLLGFPDVVFNSTDLVAHEISITGSFLGNRATMREMLTFAEEHKVLPEIELMPMARVNEAIQRVKMNKARYRIVLVNDGTDGSGTGMA
jgi:uncharacterized zinc-type alcohol dehydrogenase-like protein